MSKTIICLSLFILIPIFALADTARFKDSESNVRTGPSTKSSILTMPPAGTLVELLKVDGKWFQIRFQDGRTGWVHKRNVDVLTEDPTPAPRTVENFMDGKTAVIHYIPMAGSEWGENYRLRIDVNGRTFWEDREEKYPIFIGDGGVGEVTFAGDIDGDGAPDLILREPQSDVSPATLRWLHFAEGRFTQRLMNSLMSREASPQKLTWQVPPDTVMDHCFVMKFDGLISAGLVKAELWRFVGDRMDIGTAALRVTAGGATIERMLEEFKPCE